MEVGRNIQLLRMIGKVGYKGLRIKLTGQFKEKFKQNKFYFNKGPSNFSFKGFFKGGVWRDIGIN
jgi:hypothetical protein